MVKSIALWIIQRKKLKTPTEIRGVYGAVCGVIGIFLNIILFALKAIVGIVSGSIAVISDAANNLSDAGSSIITYLGFKLASHKPDKEHPFGHGRYEYVAGLIVALAIILVGIELVKSSVEKIIKPTEVTFSWATIIVLIVSIIVKLIMMGYNSKYGKEYSSETLIAVSQDSRNDMLTTTIVLIATILMQYIPFPIDAWMGLLVAVFIVISGIDTFRQTINPLLGVPPTKEFVDKINSIVLSYPKILGVHDLVVHNYGPGRIMISLHAEVSSKDDLLDAHDVIDNAERELIEKLGCSAVIHLDPIVIDDEKTNEIKRRVEQLIQKIDTTISIHDFRMIEGTTHTNLVFDMVIPYDIKKNDQEIKQQVIDEISQWTGNYHAVIEVDKTSNL